MHLLRLFCEQGRARPLVPSAVGVPEVNGGQGNQREARLRGCEEPRQGRHWLQEGVLRGCNRQGDLGGEAGGGQAASSTHEGFKLTRGKQAAVRTQIAN